MAAPVSSEETAMVVLGKDSSENKVSSNGTQHQSLDYFEETLPWDQSWILKMSKTEARPSPEGSREEATVDNDIFTVATKQEDKENSEVLEVEPHVFVPIEPCCIEHAPKRNETRKKQHGYDEEIVHCETEKGDAEKQNFIPHGYSAHFDDLPGGASQPAKKTSTKRPPCLPNGNCSSISLKAIASMMGALVVSPCLIYGAYVFLPFDAPLMPTMGYRLVYTLRCGVFATFPIIVGMVVYGVSRLCFSSLQPFGELRREVEIHRRYISQSVQLFILYFFNIAVLATYLPQESLKLIPLLTALFAISRLLYWIAFAMGRAFRGFGFGLTFLPLVAMLLFNLYSMFLADAESIFATKDMGDGSATEEERLAAAKPWFWG